MKTKTLTQTNPQAKLSDGGFLQGPSGSSTGKPFNFAPDMSPPKGNIYFRKLTVYYSNSELAGMKLTCWDGKELNVGTVKTSATIHDDDENFDPADRILKVLIYQIDGARLQFLQIVYRTSDGRLITKNFGAMGAGMVPNAYVVPDGYRLKSFWGRGSGTIDALGVVYELVS